MLKIDRPDWQVNQNKVLRQGDTMNPIELKEAIESYRISPNDGYLMAEELEIESRINGDIQTANTYAAVCRWALKTFDEIGRID